MARTTSELVAKIVTVRAGDDLGPFISMATGLVDDECLGSDYTDGKFELIERNLAAHFYVTWRPRSKSGGINPGPTESKDLGARGYMLKSTSYGQAAISLDTDGNLAALTNAQETVKKALPPGNAGSKWLGTAFQDWI